MDVEEDVHSQLVALRMAAAWHFVQQKLRLMRRRISRERSEAAVLIMRLGAA